ncbi:sensor histidine kinase [Bacteroides timonensis]|uniref:sensor histidine kinase n=1 Tax=Bacteroides timonensis TaxID=1470345 RepID=UPI0004B9CFED|nr:histidine kinase [Bacteroides timonensis]
MTKDTNRKYWVLILLGLLSFLALFLYLIELLTAKQTFTSVAFIKSVTISFPFMALIAWVDYKLVSFINDAQWFSRHLMLRIAFEGACISLLAAVFVILGNIPFRQEEGVWEYLMSMRYGEVVVTSILFNVFAVTVIEFFVQSRKKQLLQQENVRMQYRQLKSQINPHFLFNSLNVLVSLINKDSERATDYTKKLSDVYRYVLTHDLEDTVSVHSELEFIQNYIEILQIRFGDGLNFTFDVRQADMQREIPPMTLQVLVENAVKHNALTASSPLTIHISSDNRDLIVSNNIIPRMRIENSMGIGLENIKEKYDLIAGKTVSIIKTDQEFAVKLPLL